MKSMAWGTAVLTLCLSVTAWAAPDKSVTIHSESLKIQERTGDISFEGDVEARMADVVLYCDLLTVQADKVDPSRILSGKASGNVALIKGSERVEASHAVFDLEKGQVVLTGGPRMTREGITIEAQQIIFSIDAGTASFMGTVRALFKAPGDQ